jgi:hypothetical protein
LRGDRGGNVNPPAIGGLQKCTAGDRIPSRHDRTLTSIATCIADYKWRFSISAVANGNRTATVFPGGGNGDRLTIAIAKIARNAEKSAGGDFHISPRAIATAARINRYRFNIGG